MAIDRTKAYYKEWVNDRGWNLRLEIVPAGIAHDNTYNMIAVTYEPMARGAVSIKTHKESFNKIPMGIKDAASMEIEFQFADLQDNLKEMIKNPFFNHAASESWFYITSNLIILKSDRGEGHKDGDLLGEDNPYKMYVEFFGGQRATRTNDYMIRKDIVTGDFVTESVTIEALDVLKLVLEQIPVAVWAGYIVGNSHGSNPYYTPVIGTKILADWYVSWNTTLYAKLDYEVGTAGNVDIELLCLNNLFTHAIQEVVTIYMSYWSRYQVVDFQYGLLGSPFEAITYFEQDFSLTAGLDHLISTSLDKTEILAVGTIYHGLDATPAAGMLVQDKGNESYLEYKYMWDLLKNICEGNCCKFTFHPINNSGTHQQITYASYFSKLFENPPSNTVPDLRDTFANAQTDTFKFTPSSNVFLSATSELKNLSGTDIDHFDSEVWSTKGDNRINAQLIHHNLPTTGLLRGGNTGTQTAEELRIHPRKLYYATGDAAIPVLKVHESVAIDDGLTTITYYDYPVALPSVGIGENGDKLVAWAVATQAQNGTPRAVSQFYLERFSNPMQNECTVKMFMENGKTMPQNIGFLCLIPTIDGFEGSEKASMIEMESDWGTGTVDINFSTRGA